MSGYRVEIPPQLPSVVDRAMAAFMRGVNLTLRSLLVLPWLRAGSFSVVEGVAMTPGTVTVAHGLGRAPVGLLVLSATSNMDIPGITAGDETTVSLLTGQTATVSFLFW